MSRKTLKPRTASESVITNVVTPHDTNYLGTLFGGTLMAWMRYARSVVVTAAVDALQFSQPVKLGWVVTARARINYVGNTSCEVGVKVMAEDTQSGKTVHAASAYLTMVALDKEGKPCPLPPLLVQSESEKRRQKAAETRRALRLALQRRTAAVVD